MITTFKSNFKCEILGLDEGFQGICFGHVFFKACQYATINEKVYKNLWFISIKSTQLNLQKCITSGLKGWERQTRMEHGMFKFKHSPKKIEYSNKNKTNF